MPGMPRRRTPLPYTRVMLKLSGEAFLGRRRAGIDPQFTKRIAEEIADVHRLGVSLCVTVGGGNFFRGTSAAEHGMERATGDYLGMLATVMNALALQSALANSGLHAHVHSAIRMDEIAEPYIRARALSQVRKRHIVIFSAGTGNPFFSTDMAAALRALEMKCAVILKGTIVGGVYTKDPRKHRGVKKLLRVALLDAVKDPHITIVDNSALALCADHQLPIVVFDITKRGLLERACLGERVGTVIN